MEGKMILPCYLLLKIFLSSRQSNDSAIPDEEERCSICRVAASVLWDYTEVGWGWPSSIQSGRTGMLYLDWASSGSMLVSPPRFCLVLKSSVHGCLPHKSVAFVFLWEQGQWIEVNLTPRVDPRNFKKITSALPLQWHILNLKFSPV